MLRRIPLAALALLLTGTGLAPAQPPTVLDLIPADAAAAVAIQNLDRLKTRGDKLIADAKLQGVPRPSELFAEAYKFLGVQGGIDMDGSAAIILARPEKEGEAITLPSLQGLLVAALPVSDGDKVAAAFGLKPGQLRPGKVVEGKFKTERFFLLLRGKHLFVSFNDKTLARVSRAKTLRNELPAGRRKALEKADILFFLSPRGFAREWSGFLNDQQTFLARYLGPGEAKAATRLIQALREVRFVVGALRIEDGLGLTLLSVFPEKGGTAAHKLLADIRGSGRGASDLKGLPRGPVVVAVAGRVMGERTAAIARAYFGLMLHQFVETGNILSATNRPVYTEVLGAVWQRLKGSRGALYESSDEHKYGLFSLVAILDTEDAAKFVGDMRALSHIALEPEAKVGGKEAGPDIPRLVRDLGDPKYRVRASATLKLRLIGEPALPLLKKAMAAPELELSRRAERLWEQIGRAAAERRKEMLAKGLPRHLHPSFAFASKPEERAGHRVEVVRITLGGKEVPAVGPGFVQGLGGANLVKQLRGLLGPDWDRLRLAAVGNHVVVLLGSETELLDRTLANLKDGKPGLAAAKGVAAFARQAGAGRTIEFHVSVQRILALTTAPVLERPAPPRAGSGLTSFGLTVGADDLRLDFGLPVTELRVIAKQIR